jgi:hypothetical protein
MFNQYGSVLCNSCESSMRLATIEPGEAGTSTATFECRYPPCAESRVMGIGKMQLGQDVLSVAAWPGSSVMNSPSRSGGLGLHFSRRRRQGTDARSHSRLVCATT